MKNNPANFALRLLATLLDTFIYILLFILCIYFTVQKPTLSEAISLFLLLTILVLLNPLVLYAHIYLTYYFGATPGKLLTGMKVTDENGGRLTFKRVFFRQTVGYNFSMLLFGLGYVSMVKDPQKQTWHDKAVGSKVIVTQNLWPLGIIATIIVLSFSWFFTSKSFELAQTGPLGAEVKTLFEKYQTNIREKSTREDANKDTVTNDTILKTRSVQDQKLNEELKQYESYYKTEVSNIHIVPELGRQDKGVICGSSYSNETSSYSRYCERTFEVVYGVDLDLEDKLNYLYDEFETKGWKPDWGSERNNAINNYMKNIDFFSGNSTHLSKFEKNNMEARISIATGDAKECDFQLVCRYAKSSEYPYLFMVTYIIHQK
jgi:uncharacterized RDD family membrane protein YckC